MTPCKLLVIIAENALEETLGEDLLRLGASGYTVSDVRGRGSHGMRGAQWEADRTIRFEVLCSTKAAEEIAMHVQATYFKHYAAVLYTTDAEVLRGDKFSR